MGVIYKTSFENVTIAAVQDIFAIKAGAANSVVLYSIELTAGAVASPAEIRMRLKRLPVTVTIGSGGSTPTVGAKSSRNSTASSSTVHANDTTQATTSGTAFNNLGAWQWNVLNPWLYLPPPEEREDCQAAEALVLDIPGTPASTVVSGRIVWEEV